MNEHHSAPGNLERYGVVADAVATLMAVVALGILAVRATLRLEYWWDTFWYHIPYAARRGGLGIPYQFPDYLYQRYLGFPPLPHFVQGILWRITGSIHATGVVNYLAFALFLYFCHRKLGSRFGIVALVSLTAPLVLIHLTSSLVDLFANAFLAIGVSSVVGMYLLDKFNDRSLLLWGLVGLAGAAWSKYQAMPMVVVFLIVLLIFYGVRRHEPEYRPLFRLVLIGTLIAAAPYIKNLILYHNPFWPVRMPVIGNLFPSTEGGHGKPPPPLADRGRAELFFRSLLEIGHPNHYPDRERWTIDQSRSMLAYRSGGFWNVAVLTANAAICLLALLFNRRKALVLIASMAAVLCLISFVPDSQELRYYQFLPLTWAATIAMLLPRIRRRYPVVALTVLSVLVAEFVYVSRINRNYYRIERIGYTDIARMSLVSPWWDRLERGKVYCTIGFMASDIMLTGPTMSEFHIVKRATPAECPPNTTIIHY